MLAQRVNSPMHIRVPLLAKTAVGLQHLNRLLRTRRIVKVNQRIAVDLDIQNRKILADIFPFQREMFAKPALNKFGKRLKFSSLFETKIICRVSAVAANIGGYAWDAALALTL